MPPVISAPSNLTVLVGAPDPRQAWSAVGAVSNNDARLSAFQVRRPVSVSTANFHVQTQSGNIDLGIYVDDGAGNLTRLVMTGSFSCPSAVGHTQALQSTVLLTPGLRYYGATAFSTTATKLYGSSMGVTSTFDAAERLECLIASSFPLPATLTFDTTTSDSVSGPFLLFT